MTKRTSKSLQPTSRPSSSSSSEAFPEPPVPACHPTLAMALTLEKDSHLLSSPSPQPGRPAPGHTPHQCIPSSCAGSSPVPHRPRIPSGPCEDRCSGPARPPSTEPPLPRLSSLTALANSAAWTTAPWPARDPQRERPQAQAGSSIRQGFCLQLESPFHKSLSTQTWLAFQIYMSPPPGSLL